MRGGWSCPSVSRWNISGAERRDLGASPPPDVRGMGRRGGRTRRGRLVRWTRQPQTSTPCRRALDGRRDASPLRVRGDRLGVVAVITLIVIDRSRHILSSSCWRSCSPCSSASRSTALDCRLPRWAATTIIVLASIASVAGLLALGSVQLSQEIDVVGEAVAGRIESVDPDSTIGQFLVDGRVGERIQEHLDELPSQVVLGSPDPADGARLGLEALLVIVLMLYALAEWPTAGANALGGEIREWWSQSVRDGVRSGASQVRRLLAVAVISGLIGLAIVSLFGLEGTTMLAIGSGCGRWCRSSGRSSATCPGRAGVARRMVARHPRRRARRTDRRRQLVRRPSRVLLGHPIHRPAYGSVRADGRPRRGTPFRMADRPARGDPADSRRGSRRSVPSAPVAAEQNQSRRSTRQRKLTASRHRALSPGGAISTCARRRPRRRSW